MSGMPAPERRPFRAQFQARECLAIRPSALDGEHDVTEAAATTEGQIAVVGIAGPLEHHASWLWDSYDSIVDRVAAALDSEASVVVMRIDSPGGDANGATEASRTIRRMADAAGKPLYAYVDESCYSAAYELAVAADEIWLPETGGCGSVGVIATLVDRTKALDKAGVRVALVTTGKRKADTYPDRELTSEVLETVQARVDELGEVFFGLVSERRGMSVAAVKALEAGCFAGPKAVEAGLADGVSGWAEFLSVCASAHLDATLALQPTQAKETRMAKILSLTKTRDAARAAVSAAQTDEDRAKALAALEASTAALVRAESDDDAEEDEDEKSEDCEEDKAEDEEDEDEAAEDSTGPGDDAEEDEDDKAAAKSGLYTDARLLRLVQQVTGQKGRRAAFGALDALGQKLKAASKLEARLAKMETERRTEKVAAMLKAATRDGRITPAQVAPLKAQGGKDPKWLKGYLATLPKRVRSTDDGPIVASEVPAGGQASAEVPAGKLNEAVVNAMAASLGITPAEAAAKINASLPTTVRH
jgi:signal peptide peptidase SppA